MTDAELLAKVRAMGDDTLSVLARVQKTGTITRGDVALLSVWYEIWNTMDDQGVWKLALGKEDLFIQAATGKCPLNARRVR